MKGSSFGVITTLLTALNGAIDGSFAFGLFASLFTFRSFAARLFTFVFFLRSHLLAVQKCHLSKEHVTAMQIGMLDLLCVLPHEQVEEYGIPYLRSILDKDALKKDME